MLNDVEFYVHIYAEIIVVVFYIYAKYDWVKQNCNLNPLPKNIFLTTVIFCVSVNVTN